MQLALLANARAGLKQIPQSAVLAKQLAGTEVQGTGNILIRTESLGNREGRRGCRDKRGGWFDADAKRRHFQNFTNSAPVQRECDGGAHGAASAIRLREHVEGMTLLKDSRVALILPRRARQWTDSNGHLRQKCAFRSESIGSLEQP